MGLARTASRVRPVATSTTQTLAFLSTREGGAQVWLLPIAGGDAHKVSSLADGASDPVWFPDGSGLLVVSDIKWPANQEIDQRNGAYPTEARIWTDLLWRHWDDLRAGKRQHLFRVDVATGKATDLTPVDHDVPTIATSGDGDVAVSPDSKEIAVATHSDTVVADNTNVDPCLLPVAGDGPLLCLTWNRGADNTPRYSPNDKWLAYLSMERAGFEADRQRLMLVDRTRVGTRPTEATAGWDQPVVSYTWCPNSKCIYAVVEERGRDNIYRIDIPGFKRTRLVSGGVNTGVQVGPDSKTLVYLHQTNTQPPEVWVSGKALTHHNDSALATLDLPPLEEFGFVGALGDSVFGWSQKPPGFDPARKYPLIYLIHGGPQGAWTDSWGPRWNNQMFAGRGAGFVVAEVNFHGSTGYGQKFTDAISQHWGDYPFEDLMKGLDVVARLPYVDSTRMGAAGASYGGYMVYWIAGHTNRFKVLVDHDGVFNTVSMAGSTEELWFTDWEFAGPVYAPPNRALYEKWSPLNHVSDWKTPMLIVHSQLDYRVDLSEGYQAFTAEKRMGVDAKFLYVREVEELRIDAHALRGRECLIAFGQIHAVVQLRMHDQHRRLPVAHMIQRRPLFVKSAVRGGIHGAGELPVREPQLLGAAGHADRIEHAVVIHQHLEAVGVARDPVPHVSAVGGAGGAHARRVDVRQAGDDVQPFHEVFERVVAPMLRDRVGELLAVARRAVEVHLGNDESRSAACKHLIVPARTPAVGPRPLRAAVNEIDQRILPGGIEARRLLRPAEHRVAERADETELLERRQIQRRESGVVVMGQRFARDPDLGGLGVRLVEIDQGLTVGAYLYTRVNAARNEASPFESRNVDAIDVVSSSLLDHRIDALRVWAPRV